MKNQEQLKKLCMNLGAPAGQAETMAAQLLKRSEQLAKERGCSQVDAMEYLLKVLISGRKGEVYSEPAPGKGLSGDEG